MYVLKKLKIRKLKRKNSKCDSWKMMYSWVVENDVLVLVLQYCGKWCTRESWTMMHSYSYCNTVPYKRFRRSFEPSPTRALTQVYCCRLNAVLLLSCRAFLTPELVLRRYYILRSTTKVQTAVLIVLWFLMFFLRWDPQMPSFFLGDCILWSHGSTFHYHPISQPPP